MSDPLHIDQPQQRVGILMAVYNGADCLDAQLESLAAQEHKNWHLLASDDGSNDGSLELLARFANSNDVTCLDGPGRGAAQNFMSLLRRADDHLPEGSWLAFCDQDDVWLPDRLSRGLCALMAGEASQPALFCSRTWIVDSHLEGRRLSPPRPRSPGFLNALAQNIVAGNTILLNPMASRLLMTAAKGTEEVVMHDWWAYQMVSGAGGRILHDDAPTLLYRQHADNEVGANIGWRAKMSRLNRMLRGDFRRWNDTNIAALRASSQHLTAKHNSEVEAFAELRTRKAPGRVLGVMRLGLYRQTATSTLALWVAACLRRL